MVNGKGVKNLNDAIDAYVSRVNGCPCGDTQINLRVQIAKRIKNSETSSRFYAKSVMRKRRWI